MVCDLVYSSDDAEWGFPEIKLGCFPPVACTALAALVGQKRAAELILTGRIDRRQGSGRDWIGDARCERAATGLCPARVCGTTFTAQSGGSGGCEEGELCVGLDAL